MRKSSFPTVKDLFCGAGGSSKGAQDAGAQVISAANHWRRACETYATNHGIEPECADISQSDPRNFPRTDILIASPECTNFSSAKGISYADIDQEQLFGCDLCRRHGESNCPKHSDPVKRSRAGGWDVVKFTEFHRYEIVVIENVVQWLDWQDFDRWWKAMENLGYVGQKVFFNSMFAPPTPQSRDRLYIVWHRKGNRPPDVDLRPLAFCAECGTHVEARQVFKPKADRKARHGKQYFYACPQCREVVQPYYFAALNAIDLSIPAPPIGERAKYGLPPLKPRTLERIRYGIDRYGSQPLLITTNHASRLGSRVRSAFGPGFTQPACPVTAVASPFVVDTAFQFDGAPVQGVRPVDVALQSQTTRQTLGVVSPFVLHMQGSHRAHGLNEALSTQVASCPQDALLSPFIVNAANTRRRESRVRAASDPTFVQHAGGGVNGVTVPPPGFMLPAGSNLFDPRGVEREMPTLTTSDRGAFALSPAFIANLRGTGEDQLPYTNAPVSSPLGTISAGGIHSAIINLRDWKCAKQLVSSLDAALPTQVATAQTGIVTRSPFVVSYYSSGGQQSGVDEPVPAITTLPRHGIVIPSIEEWCFRMFKPPEIGIGMAFPPSYVVLGTEREQVRQYGNAVTPPVMRWLLHRCIESLYPERERYDPWAEWRSAA